VSDFYTGSPLDPDDLWFREEFVDLLWDILSTEHVLLTAPRRTGKTSVMDYMAAKPQGGYSAISVFVQDLDHPSEFLLTLLDAFMTNILSFSARYSSPVPVGLARYWGGSEKWSLPASRLP